VVNGRWLSTLYVYVHVTDRPDRPTHPPNTNTNRGPKILAGELLEKGKKTLVLCHHGGRSMQVASFLTSQAGFAVRE